MHDAEPPPRTAVSAASQHSQAMRPPTSQRRASNHNAKQVWREIRSVELDHLMGLGRERALIKPVCVGTCVVGTGAVLSVVYLFPRRPIVANLRLAFLAVVGFYFVYLRQNLSCTV